MLKTFATNSMNKPYLAPVLRFFMKIHGFRQFFKNKKFNVLYIIFYVKTRADSKKMTNIYQMCRFLAFMAKKRILERNYEKMLHLLQ